MGTSRALKGLNLFSAGCPITLQEFSNTLLSIWRAEHSYGINSNLFGLAISGGVDSMALAALCSKLQRDQSYKVAPIIPGVRFQAFIVDHGVRVGSDAEADAVSKMLIARGLPIDPPSVYGLTSEGVPTKVLTIDWNLHEAPAELPNFESLARKYRFRALGKACRQFGINSLLLAHHEDDQAETVMMRIIRGHRMQGLSGMKRKSEIPECRGLHGVHESGRIDAVQADVLEKLSSSISPKHGTHTRNSDSLKPLRIEGGGVKVYRPLLGFRKSRLISTCQTERMEWFEDHTNQIPSITMRNAIRHMLRTHDMPVALRPKSFVDLSESVYLQRKRLESIARKLLKECKVAQFEARTGILRISFSTLHEVQMSTHSWRNRGLIAALLLRQIILFVTPEEDAPLSSLHAAVHRIFPEVSDKQGRTSKPMGFTVAGVQFQPFELRIPEHESAGKCEWLISRQPYPSSSPKLPLIYVPPSGNLSTEATWSAWELYDGRFWIRIQNRSADPIVIRPFRQNDLTACKALLEDGGKNLQALLKKLAPGNVRWTLPVAVKSCVDGNQKIVSLPTLDVSLQDVEGRVDYEVRYKQVDTGRLPPLR